jgi:uncharacterized protein involved in exopolysaccharide biosynthesis
MTVATDDDLGQLLATVTAAMQRIIDWADGRLNALQRADDELRAQITSLQQEVKLLRVGAGAMRGRFENDVARSWSAD